MSLSLAWMLVLLLELGDPSFDPEIVCATPASASSPLCVASPFAELLPAEAAVRARLLLVVAALQDAVGDAVAARRARDAADEALELALTDRRFAHGWLAQARAALGRARHGLGMDDEPPSLPGLPDGVDEADPATARDALREARESLRR